MRANIVLAMQAARGWVRQIPRSQQDEIADRYIKALDIRPANPEQLVRNLSGGNQQKVLLGRWLLLEPRLLILDEPTRGIDIGAKAQIQKLVADLAEDGLAVIFISAELEEVVRLSHHVGVLRDRRKVARAGQRRPDRRRHPRGHRRRSGAPRMSRLTSHRLLWPVAVLVALLVANLLANHSFLSVTVQDGNLFGPLVDILRRAAPIILVALGMTLVIATRGIDLSVGAVAAISGSWASMHIVSSSDRTSVTVILVAVAVALVMAVVAGLFNGFLVSVLRIQPIVATLVLMTAGRGLAQVITNEKILYPDNAPGYKLIGGGYLLGRARSRSSSRGRSSPSPRRSPGARPWARSSRASASTPRRAGWPGSRRPGSSSWSTSSAPSAPASPGLMLTSNSTSADPNSIGLFIELDAILAVVIGGTSLAGGRFSLWGTLVGAFIIETMNTFVVIAISPRSTDVFKAARRRGRLPPAVAQGPPVVRRPAPPPRSAPVPSPGGTARAARGATLAVPAMSASTVSQPERRRRLRIEGSMSTATPAATPRSSGSRILTRLGGYSQVATTVALLVVMLVVGTVLYPNFTSPQALVDLLGKNAFLIPLAVGMTFVILSGGIDLSVGAVMALGSVIAATLLQQGWSAPVVIVAVLLVGSVLGRAGRPGHQQVRDPALHRDAGRDVPRPRPLPRHHRPVDHHQGRALPQDQPRAPQPLPGPGHQHPGPDPDRRRLHDPVGPHRPRARRRGLRRAPLHALRPDRVRRRRQRALGVPDGAPGGPDQGRWSTPSADCAPASPGCSSPSTRRPGDPVAGIGYELNAIAAVVIGGTLLSGGAGYVFGSVLGVLTLGTIYAYKEFDGDLNTGWTRILIGVLVLFFIVLQRLIASRKWSR